jgi:hypothetical protein
MGWWKIQGTENAVGDGPLDALGGAVMSVIAEYEAAFNRRPTKAEWEALLVAVLGTEEADERVLDNGVVRSVHIESS